MKQKPCPKCGGEGDFWVDNSCAPVYFKPRCKSCGYEMGWYFNKLKAVKDWNAECSCKMAESNENKEKWNCSICGEVEPKGIMYSYPAQATCPKCGKRIEDGKGITIIEDEEICVRLRPSFYKKSHPEIYEKYFGDKTIE